MVKEREGFSEAFSEELEAKYHDEHSWLAKEREEQAAQHHAHKAEQLANQQEEHVPAQKDEKKHQHHPHRRKRFETFLAVYLVLLLVFIFLMSVSADSNAFMVLMAIIPTFFVIFVSMFLYESKPNTYNVLWPVPLVVVLIFYFLAKEVGGLTGKLDLDTLTGVNIFLSYLYIVINYFLLRQDVPATGVKVVVKEAPIPEDLAQFIASIEDKSKALNFVIGRVYNAYHGGTKELREKINMKQEWYDQFSKIPSDSSQIDFKALGKLLTKIELRLKQLEKKESEVFGLEHTKFKHLVRNAAGNDRVIDVLDKNDKDPVSSYYEGALQFVQKIRDLMKVQEVPEVKNEYVEKT